MNFDNDRRKFLGKMALGTMVGLAPWNSLLANSPIKAKAVEKAFIPVMLTPYKADMTVDYKGLKKLTDYYLESGARGLFANCLSSEMYDLSPEERLKVTKTVVKKVNGKFPVVATGSFGNTAAEKAEFTKKIADTGVDAVIMITSHFAEKGESDDVVIKNLEDYLALTGNIPLGTYECPSPYKRILSQPVLKFLLESGRFVYHKDTSEDIDNIIEKLETAKGSKLGLYNAHMGSAAASLRNGGAGLSPIAGNYYPEVIAWLCKHADNSGKKEQVDWLQEKLRDMESRITKNYMISSRYYLNKEGLDLELVSRRAKNPLTADQKDVVDQCYAEVQEWKQKLSI
ncbi:dihydrodipicolinate synthase family protein [Cyclobacterium sp. 1_MG-2023]|uniref:dihydrodipicolinate synthase family protein n=1 Tax=Cyclobacterium sp. 1_MG-2023 TaxID=3062681 RepID=UPI0026E2F412|nr:dihydrodipicolinate synthase family protein [Cyclobacterium sp. 1_MG-2023]MDO6439904.1 dihydrodipicolinate synthase family protein [Cyclobacterium sp. 1_MG-2023]